MSSVMTRIILLILVRVMMSLMQVQVMILFTVVQVLIRPFSVVSIMNILSHGIQMKEQLPLLIRKRLTVTMGQIFSPELKN